MVFGDMEYDRAGLEQDEIAVLESGNLAERMTRQMRGLLHRLERNRTDRIGFAHFFERPADARISCKTFAAVR